MRQLTVVLQRLAAGRDDDLELGWVLASSLVVLFVVVDVDLIGSSGRFALFPEDVLNRLPGLGPHVGVNVQLTAASGLLVATVDALTRRADNVQVQVVVVVPHQ